MAEVLWGGITMETAAGVFPLTTDSMALAHFTRLRRRERICDLGCGGGTLGLLLCGKRDDCAVTGVEVQEAAVEVTVRNIRRNGLEGRMAVCPGDLRDIRALLPASGFTSVVSNPPYFPAASLQAPAAAKAAARSQGQCTAEDLCRAAAWLLSTGGRFSLVYRPEALCDLFCALRGAGLEPKRLQPVRHKPTAPVSVVLVEALSGGKPGLRWEPELVLYQEDGSPTADYAAIYHL